jgi:hypothetical protein
LWFAFLIPGFVVYGDGQRGEERVFSIAIRKKYPGATGSGRIPPLIYLGTNSKINDIYEFQ